MFSMQPSSALHRKRQDDECAHELGKLRYRVDAEQVYLKIGRESQCRRPRRCQWPSQWQRLLGQSVRTQVHIQAITVRV